MTATPIPRTLALTECGDMEVSVIRGLPPGRQPIKTIVKADSRRDEAYAMMRDEIRRGRQVYVIYPLVEESEKIDLKAATEMCRGDRRRIFPEFSVALLHGRMKGDEKEARDARASSPANCRFSCRPRSSRSASTWPTPR